MHNNITRQVYQSLHTSAGGKRGSGLIKSNVTVRTNSSKEQLNTTVLGDLSLVVSTLRQEIGSISIQDMDIAGTRYYSYSSSVLTEYRYTGTDACT